MARHEADREDLMAEATALSPRIELAVRNEPEPIVAGFRSSGLSIYFGGDPVYQFDDRGRLRRAFSGGWLYRTQGSTLARLTRLRMTTATELVRHDLSPGELAEFLAQMHSRLVKLVAAIEAGDCRTVREVPADSRALERLAAALNAILEVGETLAPAIRGKR